MKSKIIIFSFAFLLFGCAFDKLDQGIPRLYGKHIDQVINYLGIPDSEQNIAGKKVYIWGHQQTGSYMMPVTSHSNASAYGSGGYAYASGTTTSYVPQYYNHQCIIKLIANKKDIIEGGQYEGNLAGCSAFQSAMQRIIDDTTPSKQSSDKLESNCYDINFQKALETTSTGKNFTWKNSNNIKCTIAPHKTYQSASGQYCREYQQTIVVSGKSQSAYGTACRQPDGSWQVTN